MTLPEKFGHYEVYSEIGRGGMAVVYKCWEESLNRHVAIKVLSSHLAQDQDVKERFFREARSMAAISHPNVINVHFIGEQSGQPYFAMELIKGKSLSEIFANNRVLDVEHAKNILYQSCEGLLAAHDLGLIHRDIKPGNLMIANNGFLKLLDFGIAQSNKFDTNLTQTGEIVGTPGYLSPETCVGEKIDQRSDIYSLGIVFYQMLAGEVPFDTSTPYKLLTNIVESDISNIQDINKNVDDKTAKILLKMISKNPDDRFQNCQEILDALGKTTNKSSIRTIIKHSKICELKTQVSENVDSDTKVNITKKTKLKKDVKSTTNTISFKKYIWSLPVILTFWVFYILNSDHTNEFYEQNIDINALENTVYISDFEGENQVDKMGELMASTESTEDNLSLLLNSCLQINSVTVLKPKKSRWLPKKAPNPPASLLTKLRSRVVNLVENNTQLKNSFNEVKRKCLPNEKAFKLSMQVTAYKNTSRSKKPDFKTSLGTERITLILTLINLNTKNTIAQKKIESKSISNQLNATDNKSEFIKTVKLFLEDVTI